MTDAAIAMGRVVADRYVIGRVLGSGTMGTVRAAFDLDLDREVAIKFVSAGDLSREEIVERFRREVHVAARIKSEHVVRVLDVGSLSNGMPFMVMELLEGRGLDAERELRGVIPVDEAVGYVLPAIEVLAEAHAAGVVHRDIKPANLFLVERANAPRFLKVLDFGVSKSDLELALRDGAITKTGVIMGSPLYMAPEQLRSTHRVDARADIWSLGAILFELVTGFTAHEGDSVAEICATLLRDPPRSIGDFASELPPGFAEVVMRCLEPDRERRYANVAELGAALLPFAPRGAVHVERARRVLVRVAESIAPSSDSPVTLHVGREPTSDDAEVVERYDPSFEERSAWRGFRMARAGMAFALVGLGIGTAFLIEFPRRDHAAPRGNEPAREVAAARPPATVLAAPPAPTVSSVPSARSPLPEPGVAPSSAPRPAARTPVRWTSPKRRTDGARPRTAASAEISDFGGRR